MPALHMLINYYCTVLLALFLGLLFYLISRRTKHVLKHLPINIYTGANRYDKYDVNLLKITICLNMVRHNNMHIMHVKYICSHIYALKTLQHSAPEYMIIY